MKKSGHSADPAPPSGQGPERERASGEDDSFPVVGIGASAGGLEAFSELLRGLPEDTGMAFVVISHLHPGHPSALAEILSHATRMPVQEVTDEPAIEPNRVYVIPPARNMVVVGRHLQLLPRAVAGAQRPIDIFFRSLAAARRQRSIGVVLSGTANDGALGLEEIKGAGGITYAQDDSAAHGGMPHNAVATGCVDLVLRPAEIARDLVRVASHPYVAPLPAPSAEPGATHPEPEALAQILKTIRNGRGIDFSSYKGAMLLRRISRRMLLQGFEKLAQYDQFLKDHPEELDALYHDILINVTSFFRDPEMFEALKSSVFPALVDQHGGDVILRAWVLGCSTGEEAYSLAMAFLEFKERSQCPHSLQILASDLNEEGIVTARAGIYSKGITTDVSPQRLRRFFEEVDGHYRVTKVVREMCVFSRHNALVDPPFSRLDLVLCRNVLIYFGASLQERLLPILHYALRPGGRLVLGSAETVGSSNALFELLDGKHRIYANRAGAGARLAFDYRAGEARPPGFASRPHDAVRIDLLEEADRILLSRYAPAAVLVNPAEEILQFRGDTSAFIAPASGRASLNLLKLVRPELVAAVRAALDAARKSAGPIHQKEIPFGQGAVDLEVLPVREAAEGAFLIIFRESAPLRGDSETGGSLGKLLHWGRTPAPGTKPASPAAEQEIARLTHELALTRAYAQSLVEQHETAAADLQSANEEAQSSNEELQSINEELETSKEEIQSSNEELVTVNEELNRRNAELTRSNDDLTNLFASVDVPILILGKGLEVRRFNQSAEDLLRLVRGDVGRPIGHVKLNLVTEFQDALEEVVRTLVAKELEVQDRDGRWFLLRIRPYWTLDNRIEGAVLAFLEVDSLRRARAYAEAIVSNVGSPLVVLDPKLRVRTVNRAFCEMFKVSPGETVGQLLYDLGNGQWNIPELRRLLEDILPGKTSFHSFRVERNFASIGPRTMLLDARRFNPSDETEGALLLSILDVTESERLTTELKQRVTELASADRRRSDFLAVLSHELRSPLNAICGWVNVIRHAGATEDALERGIEAIDRNSRLQARLIADLVDVHRLDSGKVRLDVAPVDIRSIVEQAIEAVLPRAAEKEIGIERDIDPGPLVVKGDAGRLHQALGNLLVNAIKFTPRKGSIQVVLRGSSSEAVISIRDTGIGIDAQSMPQLFQRFRQVDSATSRIQGGLGLGLSIAKQLVELHGGKVAVESEGAGKGSTFTITLPLGSDGDEKHPLTREDPLRAGARPSLKGVKVLVVDDDLDAREPLRRVLEEAGAEVVTAASAKEAIETFERQDPDVIVSDIAMPGQSGYDLVRTIHSSQSAHAAERTPAIALTAYASPEARERSLRAGFEVHLAKPVVPTTLIEAVKSLAHAGESPR
jgi:two-component system CheB/CheR fusion protein